jgi:hypothetical protein
VTRRTAIFLILGAVVSCFGLSERAHTQFNGCQAGFCSAAGPPPGYQGPGNIASGAIAFWSCGRAYNAAYGAALSSACDVVDTATGLTTCTLHFLATGFVNTTQCNATACATACRVTKMYDQTGNGNHVVQATLANMPALTFSAQNGLPCPAGTNNAATVLATAGNISQAAPYSQTLVAERTGNNTTIQYAYSNDTNANYLRFTGTVNMIIAVNGANPGGLTVADSAPHAFVVVASGVDPLIAADSSANTNTGSNGTSALASNQYLMNRSAGDLGILTGYVCEMGIWPSDLNTSYVAMLANMRSATVGWNF